MSAPVWGYLFAILKLEVIRKVKLKLQYRRIGLISTNIETISMCNRKCEFCFNHPRFESREQGEMSAETWKSIMDQLAGLKFCGRIGPHFYNEPLLDKRLPDLINYTRQVMPYCWIQINSNGDYLNEELLLKLYNKGVNYFFITNYDEDDKADFNLLAAKYPALISVVKNSDMWRTDRGGEIFHKEKLLSSSCRRPATQLVVNWRGEVLLCCMDYYAKYSFGNLNNMKLFTIWNNDEFLKIREKLKLSRQNGYSICQNCDDPGAIPW
ncbi:MAG: SPASM domain-containing protein [Candidatus Cloacimonetes bacterium]|nr:SPASM domain-containing protein [Candidatus Cloacimonadota bacterium]